MGSNNDLHCAYAIGVVDISAYIRDLCDWKSTDKLANIQSPSVY
jgi:hypothetical protein